MDDRLEQDIEKSKQVVLWFKKHSTILIIWILIGMGIGFTISKHIYKEKMNEAVKLQGFIHDNKIYDIKLRP